MYGDQSGVFCMWIPGLSFNDWSGITNTDFVFHESKHAIKKKVMSDSLGKWILQSVK